jgi:TIR domain
MLPFDRSDGMARITLSYRREDSMDITGRIFDRLTSRYGRETVFRDIDSIPPGLDFREHIRASIDDSDVLMVVVGPRWLGGERHGQPRVRSESDYVRIEVEAALDRHIPVIPLLVGGADMPEPSQLPDSIREFAYRNAVHIDSGRDFDHHMNGLIRATDKILLGATPTLSNVPDAATVPGSVDGRTSDSDPKTKPAPTGPAPQGNLFLPIVGGVMTVLGLMHIAWFTSNLLAALSTGALQQMFQQVWTVADMSFGFGGLFIGIGTIYGAHWARISGVILCLLAAFSNFLWFVEYYDKDLPRLMLVGTGLASLLAVLGSYLLLFRWPPPLEKV